MNRITDSIWLGNSSDVVAAVGKVDAMLNCAHDLPCTRQWGHVYSAHCGLVDGPGNRMSAYYSAVAQLGALILTGKKVLVYCHDGESRSAAVVMMYLYATDGGKRGWDHWRKFILLRHPLRHDRPVPAHKLAFVNLDWLLLNSVVTV